MIPNLLERSFRLPEGAPARLVEDIEHYSALVELSAKLAASAPWYERLA